MFREDLLPVGGETNRPGRRIQPVGLVIHTTANPGVTAASHRQYWGTYRASSAHIVCDWYEAITLIPWEPDIAEMAWHAGSKANPRFLGLEICEATNLSDFEKGMQIAVKATAEVIREYSWHIDRVLNHVQVTWWIGGTDHIDPLPYFDKWGYSWGDFISALNAELAHTSIPSTPESDQWKQELVNQIANITLPDGQKLLQQPRPADQPVLWWELAAVAGRLIRNLPPKTEERG